MKGVIGYSLFPVGRLVHGGPIRPYYLCRELGIPLHCQKTVHVPPQPVVKAIANRTTLLLFVGYTADQSDLLLVYLAKARRCRIILDVGDIPYLQYHYFIGRPAEKSRRDFARLVKLADVLLFTTPSMRREAEEALDLREKQCEIVENASDPKHFRATALPDDRVVSYVGAYIPARGVNELLEAIRILRRRYVNSQLRMVSVGFPTNLREDGIEILKSTYYDRIPALFESCYVFAIPHRPNPYMDMATPLKLFDAMASARPVVATPRNETAAVIEREHCGLVTSDDPQSMADTIGRLFEHESEAAEMGKRGRVAVEEKYSWSRRAAQVRKIIQQLN